MPVLLSVQLGIAQRVKIGERSILTAFNKRAVAEDIVVAPLGLFGDEQADLAIHGGLEKAVYAYPSEHYGFWQKARLDAGVSSLIEALPYGFVGENLSLHGLLETGVWAGDVLKFPRCELRLTRNLPTSYRFDASRSACIVAHPRTFLWD